jgi:hypothetical protein
MRPQGIHSEVSLLGYTASLEHRPARRRGSVAEEVAALVADATPYMTAAVGAFGSAVLSRVRDDAADATARVGRRLLQRVFGRRAEDEPLPAPLATLAADPDDADALGMVRWAVRQALDTDAAMLQEVSSMLASAQAVTVRQNIRAGRDVYIAGGDMTINRSGE